MLNLAECLVSITKKYLFCRASLEVRFLQIMLQYYRIQFPYITRTMLKCIKVFVKHFYEAFSRLLPHKSHHFFQQQIDHNTDLIRYTLKNKSSNLNFWRLIQKQHPIWCNFSPCGFKVNLLYPKMFLTHEVRNCITWGAAIVLTSRDSIFELLFLKKYFILQKK